MALHIERNSCGEQPMGGASRSTDHSLSAHCQVMNLHDSTAVHSALFVPLRMFVSSLCYMTLRTRMGASKPVFCTSSANLN